MKKETYVFLNGNIISLDKGGLTLTDLGIVRGYGFFDYLRTYNKKPLFLKEHLDRLERSSRILNLPLPYKKSEIQHWIEKLLAKNDFSESHIKIVVTGGPSPDGFEVVAPSFFILTTQLTPYPETYFSKGVKVMTYEHLRLFPEAKSLNYLTALVLRKERKRKNVFEVLFTYKDTVLEATTSNVFLFKNNILVTPEEDILEGITRSKVFELAHNNWKIEKRKVNVKELFSADEVFITASNKEVMPVVTIDSSTIADGKVGPNTKRLLMLYRDLIKSVTR